MFKSKRGSHELRPFDEMQQAIIKSHKRRWWLFAMFFIGLLVGLLIWAVTPNIAESLTRFSTAFLAFVASASAAFIGLLLLELLNWLEIESRRVENVIDILRARLYSEAQLDVMQERALISSGGLSLQTTLPLLILPLLIPLLSRSNLSIMAWLYIVLGIELIALALLSVLDRANTASILLHALAEYRAEKLTALAPSTSKVPASHIPQLDGVTAAGVLEADSDGGIKVPSFRPDVHPQRTRQSRR